MRGYPGTQSDHDTVARYNSGCHCESCTAAAARYVAGHRKDTILGRHRTVPGIGTARRLRALGAIGYSEDMLGDRLGWHHTRIGQMRRDIDRRVLTVTARAVAALYDELCMTPGPSARAKSDAFARGWVPPLAWDDGSIDDPTAEPQGAGYRRGRVIDEIRDLQGFGLNLDDIARRLRVTRDAVDIAIARSQRRSAA